MGEGSSHDESTAATTPLPPEPVLWAPEMTTVMVLADGLTRSQAKYRGYQHINDEVGIGVFYPFEFRVTKAYLRRDLRAGPESEFSHMLCAADHPEAVAYWSVEYAEIRKVWRDGAWRKAA